MSSEASFSFGINWAIGGNTGDAAIVGGVSLNGGTVSLSSSGANKTVSLPAGVSIGAILKDAITVGNTSYNIQSILNAVRGNSDVDVLATPQLHPVRFRPIHVFPENHSNEALHGNTPYFVDSG